MNENKYPSLEWCEQYGHLFPSTGCVFGKCKSCETLGIRQRGKEYFCKNLSCTSSDKFKVKMIANCPDALEIMEWLRGGKYAVTPAMSNKGFSLHRFVGDGVENGFLYKSFVEVELLDTDNWIQALMQAVELVEAK